jgi:hypothetical protein
VVGGILRQLGRYVRRARRAPEVVEKFEDAIHELDTERQIVE